MEPQERNPITTTLGSGVAFGVFLWAVLGVYTSFFRGTVPLIAWQTSRNVILGLVWLFFVLPGSLAQARTARNCFLAVAVWNHGWSLLPLAIANLIIQVLGFLLIALAWFPSSLPAPITSVEGGVVTGLITLVLVIGVLLPCNVALGRYMNWLFRDQHAEYVQMVKEDHGPVA